MSKKPNIQELIDSGILEQYALGLTTAQQNKELNSWLKDSVELQNELHRIQDGLELFAKQYAVPVPETLKSKIIQQIGFETSLLNVKKKFRTISFVSIGLLGLLSVLVAYYWFAERKQSRLELEHLTKNLQSIADLRIQDSLELADCNKRLEVLRAKHSRKILLNGTAVSPQSFAAVYYDTTARKIYLDVLDLPQTPSQKQYQLWAIVDGKPMDLGVFDLENNQTAFKEIQFVNHPQAFAITLENFGGVASPTMDQMYVIGSL